MLACKVFRAFGSPFTRKLVAKRCLPGVRCESGSTATEAEDTKVTKADDSVVELGITDKEIQLLKQIEPAEVFEKSLTSEKVFAKWEFLNNVFYGPDRDYKNFPTPRQREHPPDVKLGFVPKAWFDMMYEKTGVTGPYILGIGAVLYLISKEIVLLDPEAYDFLAALGAGYIVFKVLAKDKGVVKWFHGQLDKVIYDEYEGPLQQLKLNMETAVEELEEETEYVDQEAVIDEALLENSQLMLEGEYRRRLAVVHEAVKKRLDYQLELQNTKRRFEQEHMVQWITQSVVGSITPQLEKQSITNCINTLKTLSKTA